MRDICGSRPYSDYSARIYDMGETHTPKRRVVLLPRRRGAIHPYLWVNIACRADSLRAYPNRTNCIMV